TQPTPETSFWLDSLPFILSNTEHSVGSLFNGTSLVREDGLASCTQQPAIGTAPKIIRNYVYSRPPPWSDTLPAIFVITPTYTRPVQKAELTRLANTFLHVQNLHWVVVEDSPRRTNLQMRYTKKVSVWPVAFVGGLRYESPKVSPAGKVVGWKTVFDPNRPFAIDMAGFAISIKLILEKPQASFKLDGVKGGYQETSLLKDLVTMDGLEPKAANCTKVTMPTEPVVKKFEPHHWHIPNVQI
uniref:Galactosylgalactosylxylosylprotein 3-beta-glucuronosyltransferase n=1 Tax=Naja naja TaxID=35670 RepID=A0A8C6VKY3_NAJNA